MSKLAETYNTQFSAEKPWLYMFIGPFFYSKEYLESTANLHYNNNNKFKFPSQKNSCDFSFALPNTTNFHETPDLNLISIRKAIDIKRPNVIVLCAYQASSENHIKK